MKITLAGDLMFAQTNYAMVHAFEAETGRLVWSTSLGERTGFARGAAANSFAVYVTNANTLLALDKKTGRRIWQYNLGTIPTSTPACDEDRVMVGLTSGVVTTMNLKRTDAKGNITVLSRRAWRGEGTRGGRFLLDPCRRARSRSSVHRMGRPTRSIPAVENPSSGFPPAGRSARGWERLGLGCCWFLQAITISMASICLPRKSSGALRRVLPLQQEPMVADQEIYTINTAGNISQIDPANGEPRWTRPTQGGGSPPSARASSTSVATTSTCL